MPTILCFIDWYLPGYRAGGPVTSLANLCQHLHTHFHFRIVTRNTDYLSQQPYRQIPANEWVTGEYAEVMYLSDDQVRPATIRRLIRQTPADVIYINGIYSLYFSYLPLLFARRQQRPHVVAPRGMLSAQAFTHKAWQKKMFLTVHRILGLYRQALFHATLEQETRDIQQRIGVSVARQHLAPNLPRKINTQQPPLRSKNPGTLKLVSLARIAPEKNTLYAIQRLRRMPYGAIQYDLYGDIYNDTYWNQCLAAIDQLPGHIVVQHKGSLPPHDIPAMLHQYHWLWLPTTGENFGHAILESLLEGLPVLISDRTPWKQLAAKYAGYEIPLAQPERFEQQLRTCLAMNQATYAQWSAGAFHLGQSFAAQPELVEKSMALFAIA